ncbi:MAG TPA: FBP domain-containing protein [Galbitalea sp.]|jgi:hypothetical protein
MQLLTQKALRASFVNTSLRERNALTLPADFDDLAWTGLDFLAWRDNKSPMLGYVVVELDDEPVGVLLRQAEGRPRSRAQCSWCEDIQLPNDVIFSSAKRAGEAGRRGDTIGTLVCANFECSVNVRKRPPSAYIGFDVEAARAHRIAALGDHVRNFARDIRG